MTSTGRFLQLWAMNTLSMQATSPLLTSNAQFQGLLTFVLVCCSDWFILPAGVYATVVQVLNDHYLSNDWPLHSWTTAISCQFLSYQTHHHWNLILLAPRPSRKTPWAYIYTRGLGYCVYTADVVHSQPCNSMYYHKTSHPPELTCPVLPPARTPQRMKSCPTSRTCRWNAGVTACSDISASRGWGGPVLLSRSRKWPDIFAAHFLHFSLQDLSLRIQWSVQHSRNLFSCFSWRSGS